MSHLNVEIKARCHTPQTVREILRKQGADFRGVDRQIDTYFHVPSGRLKLREGDIETNLIHYDRQDTPGPEEAIVTLHHPERPSELKEMLSAALGVRVVVVKTREIYFVDNVKFHIDTVEELGCFVEIEAIDEDGTVGKEQLHRQCRHFMNLLGIRREDLIHCSYGDKLLELHEPNARIDTRG